MYSIKEINYFGLPSKDLNLSDLSEAHGKETLFLERKYSNSQRSAKGHVATINMPAIDCT